MDRLLTVVLNVRSVSVIHLLLLTDLSDCSSDSPEVRSLKSCENNAFCYFTGYSDFCLDRFVDHKKAGMENIVRNLVAVSKAK